MTIRSYWLAYDISNDRERARVERCVSRYGQRLQKSLFLCVLDSRRLAQLQGEITALSCHTGTILIVALSDALVWSSGGETPASLVENWVFTAS